MPAIDNIEMAMAGVGCPERHMVAHIHSNVRISLHHPGIAASSCAGSCCSMVDGAI